MKVTVDLTIYELTSKKGNTYKRAEIKFSNGYVVSEPIFDSDVSKILVYQQIMAE